MFKKNHINEDDILKDIKTLEDYWSYIDKHQDHISYNVLDDFPFYVELEPGLSFLEKCKAGMLYWVDENIQSGYHRTLVTRFYFKEEDDAAWFKLTWG